MKACKNKGVGRNRHLILCLKTGTEEPIWGR